MAGEGNENSLRRRMDLNLYLGLPRSPRPRTSDLGSDLALSSLPLSTSSTSEESRAPLEMSHAHAPYSPSHEPSIPLIDQHDADAPVDANSNQEYNPYSPFYEPHSPIPTMLPEPEELEENEEPLESYIPLDLEEGNDDPLSVYPLRTMSPLLRPYANPFVRRDIPMYSPSMPSYVSRSPSYSPPPPPIDRGDESSSRHDIFESPDYRLRRLIESSHRRLRLRRFRSSERSNLGRSSSPVIEQQPAAETNGKHKVPVEGIEAEGSDEEKEGKSQSAANFECNVCFEMAQEPVVTSCGHLFCWPCLYQWLNVHSMHKECPVCKGEVIETNITPIYGRGNSEASDRKKLAESGESNIKIPPRPRGNRFESLRQQFRPISRRFGEGITNSWRRLVNQQMRNRHRFDESNMPPMLSGAHHAVLNRLRARRLLREAETSAEIRRAIEDISLPVEDSPIPQSSSSRSLFRDGSDLSPLLHNAIEFWHRSGESTTTHPRNSDIHSIFSDGIGPSVWNRFNAYNRYGPSTSSMNPSSPEQLIPRANLASASAADQVSGSSTAAVIQGDVGFPEGSMEPNSAGSSRSSYRRRGRSSASGSLDLDGVLHARKRRRLN